MALTLEALVAQRSLGLRVLAGRAELGREIAWVHPTELADPTVFLDGGELLLTTGLTSGAEPAGDYVRRLAAAGVTGLGFGVGLSHDAVPPGLVAAAEAAAFPLLEVPPPTPFIAITKAVSSALAEERYAEVVRTGKGQQELTRTALRHRAPGALARKLARLVDGWVLLLDGGGSVREAAPASARAMATAVNAELGTGKAGTGLVSIAGDEVVVQALGTRASGFLVAGTSTTFGAAGRHLIATAAALLSLAMEQDRARGTTLRGLRTGLFELLLAGQDELALTVLRSAFGTNPDPPWTLTVLTGPAKDRAAAADVLETVADEDQSVFFAEHSSVLVVLTGERSGQAFIERIAGLHAGVSPSTTDVATGFRQARQAADAAMVAGKPLLHFTEHAGNGVLGLLGSDTAVAFADAVLGPLREHDAEGRGALADSLRCWLEHNGHWDTSAARLGIHRHTLRNRMAKTARILGRDLDSPGVRAELWLALNV
ncbi:PucR family transcriptional regulator [Prauserella marina]|uniref:Purine catabolism regulatory protein n=1 Tax=Prauserella marina TaxID=530584 RepID=A0A222VKP4_9PSEU|nr:PucR family transcriptional regulator [Prauserella marina]ASR34392.1 PucR family transcriptional regulator [Prauserella marina]PWV70566.1 purine catabolism regulator [Prauserella marina]SDE02869.1 purine catabolism regulatory protein [Prauserella marina]